VNGSDVLALASLHLGEPYRLGAFAPKDNPNWKGPWDCAELASWLVYQVSGRLVGCEDDDGDPAQADAHTGYWRRDARLLDAVVPVVEAAGLAGAFILRFSRPGRIGHIVVSNGRGGTVEARSEAAGLCASTLDGRRWDVGVRLPWLTYERAGASPVAPPRPPATLLRLGTHGDLVREVQQALAAGGLDPGPTDGIFGPHTFAAARAFQIRNGLVPDGEVGPETLRALAVRA
jgi:N-acetylmuramoyl-L-alanine amidase